MDELAQKILEYAEQITKGRTKAVYVSVLRDAIGLLESAADTVEEEMGDDAS